MKIGSSSVTAITHVRVASYPCAENREGAFTRYQGKDVELAGYTTCGGCPGETSNMRRRDEKQRR